MAQFIELMMPGGNYAYVRCASIERVEAAGMLDPKAVAPPDNPLKVVLREGKEKLTVYGCSVIDILYGIHRDDVPLARTGDEEPL